jgi:hypothetical protein
MADPFYTRLNDVVERLPTSSRCRWVAKSVAAARESLTGGITVALLNRRALSSTLRQCLFGTTEDVPLAAFADSLEYFRDCAYECKWIMRNAFHPAFSGERAWAEALVECAYDAIPMEYFHAHSELTDWIASVAKSALPPNIDAIVPPVTLPQLTQLRRCIDRRRQRLVRRPPMVQLDSDVHSSLSINTASHWKQASDYKEILESLELFERQVVYGHFVLGQSFRELAAAEGVTLSKVRTTLNAALNKLRFALRRGSESE